VTSRTLDAVRVSLDQPSARLVITPLTRAAPEPGQDIRLGIGPLPVCTSPICEDPEVAENRDPGWFLIHGARRR
jgi:hypothetical protein